MSFDLEHVTGSPVSRETFDKLDRFAVLLRRESERQNLVSRSTLDNLWQRHIADSAQLVRFAPSRDCSWADIGSGAGLPGIVLGCLLPGPVALVEPRKLRAEFLEGAVAALDLGSRVTVACSKAQNVEGRFDAITARAVAATDALLAMTVHLSHRGTVWVLPKGRRAKSELEDVRRNWHCDASIEASMTDRDSEVLVLRDVRPRGRG
jgi:16S rRNA (guanine527-N7)-methyltransferase